ncbi:MAG: beta-ketoacyl-ACP synthase II [Pseudomonadales bacterium]|nr:beta-ketoacyl-ACP synthase II [Pseudomonadales bacterium]MDP6472925.1 beta-ketoacyl-ACP synthase II [Pseudomonadales bacterium]MDP6826318.1 beta-ketoacyl-ACP synthase II [Pseudomonadales bacterium]MDP6972765.1 beta-ketoacyl-ACP synthase II [Pseudomonadales bacterium]
MTRRRVVVTGLGIISPIGNTIESAWANSVAGVSGVRAIDHFDTENHSVRIAATVPDFDAQAYMDRKEARRRDRFIQYGLAAGMQAIEDAALAKHPEDADRCGIAIGSGIGGINTIEETHSVLLKNGPRRVSPFFIPASIINMISGNLSIEYGFRGPNIAVVTACTTGAHNIGFGTRMIQHGDADVMVVGGSESSTSPITVAAFASMKALSTRNDEPERASRPWDADRDGFVLGEGAGVLVLEEYERARARGANIYAEIAGFGMSGDAHHITSPMDNGEGGVASMTNAINDAGVDVADLGYVNAHGTSTPLGDVSETRGIKTVFGTDTRIPISSSKSMIGHLLGAAGAVEAIFTIMALKNQICPPTINLENPGEGCDLDYVANTARDHQMRSALSNSFGFGGTNGTLVFSTV